jgi:two-component system nitrogen regulation response regulator GlnG
VRIQLPSLRERREDIPLLANYFLKKFGGKTGGRKSIAAAAMKALENYNWPGNVRELENIIQRATVVAKGNVILPNDFPPEILGKPTSVSRSETEISRAHQSSDLSPLVTQLFSWARKDSKLKLIPAVERELIIQALLETKGNQVQAAKLLGITRATLRKRVEKFKITRDLSIQ